MTLKTDILKLTYNNPMTAHQINAVFHESGINTIRCAISKHIKNKDMIFVGRDKDGKYKYKGVVKVQENVLPLSQCSAILAEISEPIFITKNGKIIGEYIPVN